ncbi:rngB [Symbiodinium natans]|uniref:RngB protein n=1 Tax=Symbiodinium natans TaxID=878477 RepID=A0A812LMF8_9DINO|nr:rngB [Symbiodinium natans]
MYVFGGQNVSITIHSPETSFNDLFSYDLATDTWTELTAAATERSRHSAVWDSRAKRMIVFGGVDASGIKLDDVQMSLGFP